MTNEDGSVTVVYNGEIYDFGRLRSQLEAKGHRFRSRSDTEVLVHAYEAFGDDFVRQLDGMFALALWDAKSRRLLLARDRAGKKPLYYSWNGSRFSFASETKALRGAPGVDDAIAWQRLPEFLAFGYVPWPSTMHTGILQVPPASLMVLEKGGLSPPRTYWRLRLPSDDHIAAISQPQAVEEVSELLRQAVRRRLVADVPLGVLLSGGLDSAAIVALMAQLGRTAKTFTMGFEEDVSFDERALARVVAERFGTEHTELTVRAEPSALLDSITWSLDQPLADSSSVPTWLIAREARKHVTVALGGDGGDEVFGGYERFSAALLAEEIPLPVQQMIRGVSRWVPQSESYFSWGRRLARFGGEVGQPTQRRYGTWVSLFPNDLLEKVLSPELHDPLTEGDPRESFDLAWEEAGEVPLLSKLIFANFRTYLHDDLLVKTDRMTMANSLEARSPFLDTALVEYLAKLPPRMKTTPFKRKVILRDCLADLLPRQILNRRKHGFGAPVDKWFRSSLKDVFRDLVLGPDARSSAGLSQPTLEKMLGEHLEGKRSHGPRLWAVLSLEIWLRGLTSQVEKH